MPVGSIREPVGGLGRRGPSVVAIAFLVWAGAIPALFAQRLLNTDGDLASHIFLGRKVLEHGVEVPVDWTFTVQGGVFVAYEWLSEVVLASVAAALGLAGVAALATALVAGSVALATAFLARRIEPFYALPAAMLIAVLTAARWSARPHLFSFVCLAALLCYGTARSRWRAPFAGLLFVAWANLHPEFLYGLAVYLAYLAGDAFDERNRSSWRANGVAALAASAGTLVNPLGWGLHLAVLRHLSDRDAFRMVDEFLPPSPGTVQGAVFFASLALLIALAVKARRAPPWKALLPLVLAVGAAFLSARNVALFALFALPLALRPLLDALASHRGSFAGAFRSRLRADQARSTTVPWIAGGSVALLAGALLSSRGIVRVLPNEFSPAVFPVAAVAFARAEGLTGTPIFHEYTWGGYLLYAWPGQRIYIDGMANLFGSDLMKEYRALYDASAGWRQTLEARGVDALLLPPESPLARVVRGADGWTPAHETEAAVLFTRLDP